MKPVLSSKPRKFSHRSIVLIGLMGVGKTTIGRRLASVLQFPFFDADQEIEKAAGRDVAEIFSDYGEAAFRDGERKVISRLLAGPVCVLATGGGAFMDTETRNTIASKSTSIWLRADLQELVRRTKRRNTRPLLRTGDPLKTLSRLMEQRNPIYAKADLMIDSDRGSHTNTVAAIIQALQKYEGSHS